MEPKQQLSDLIKSHNCLCDLARDLMKKKNADYTNDGRGDGGVYSNFTKAETFGICTTEQGIMVRLTDKVARLATLIRRKGLVADEKLEDTVVDLINYAVLLNCYCETLNKEDTPTEPAYIVDSDPGDEA